MASDRTLKAKAFLSDASFQASGSLSTSLRGVGIASIAKTSTEGLVDTYTITYTDGHTQTYEVTNGAQGERGPRGDKGPRGYTGFSAYQYAVAGGYEGTEEEFTQLMASNATMADTVENYSWTEEIKTALMACFENVAWVNPDGQTYYDALYAALYDRVWTITNTLTGCRNTNTMTAITKGRPYNAILERLPGYTMDGAVVTITMGGEDVSNYYSSGTISIPSVTGNVVITATAAALVPIAISAVYTQSGTVYSTATLDSLKADLVVTAEYADSTSEAVTDYTLSGELLDGATTVTVTYRNLTDTFTVNVTWKADITAIINCNEAVDFTSPNVTAIRTTVNAKRACTNKLYFKAPAGSYRATCPTAYYFGIMALSDANASPAFDTINFTNDGTAKTFWQGTAPRFFSSGWQQTYDFTLSEDAWLGTNFKKGSAGTTAFSSSDLTALLSGFTITKVS